MNESSKCLSEKIINIYRIIWQIRDRIVVAKVSVDADSLVNVEAIIEYAMDETVNVIDPCCISDWKLRSQVNIGIVYYFPSMKSLKLMQKIIIKLVITRSIWGTPIMPE